MRGRTARRFETTSAVTETMTTTQGRICEVLHGSGFDADLGVCDSNSCVWCRLAKRVLYASRMHLPPAQYSVEWVLI